LSDSRIVRQLACYQGRAGTILFCNIAYPCPDGSASFCLIQICNPAWCLSGRLHSLFKRRKHNLPNGSGCFWTIFVDLLCKR
jgi:hypothetical protein